MAPEIKHTVVVSYPWGPENLYAKPDMSPVSLPFTTYIPCGFQSKHVSDLGPYHPNLRVVSGLASDPQTASQSHKTLSRSFSKTLKKKQNSKLPLDNLVTKMPKHIKTMIERDTGGKSSKDSWRRVKNDNVHKKQPSLVASPQQMVQ